MVVILLCVKRGANNFFVFCLSSYIFQEEGLVCCKNIIFSFFVANISKDLFLFVFVCDIENNA